MGGRGIGETWHPMPLRLMSKAARRNPKEAIAWMVAWMALSEGSSATIREIADIAHCGKTVATRVRADAEAAFHSWTEDDDHKRDTASTKRDTKTKQIEPITREAGQDEDIAGTPRARAILPVTDTRQNTSSTSESARAGEHGKACQLLRSILTRHALQCDTAAVLEEYRTDIEQAPRYRGLDHAYELQRWRRYLRHRDKPVTGDPLNALCNWLDNALSSPHQHDRGTHAPRPGQCGGEPQTFVSGARPQLSADEAQAAVDNFDVAATAAG